MVVGSNLVVSIDPTADDNIKTLMAHAAREGFAFLEPDGSEWPALALNRNPGQTVFAKAHIEAELVGWAVLRPTPWYNEPKLGRLSHIFVVPDYRRRGIARSLVEFLLPYFDRFERTSLTAATDEAARLYEDMGFVKVNAANTTHELVRV